MHGKPQVLLKSNPRLPTRLFLLALGDFPSHGTYLNIRMYIQQVDSLIRVAEAGTATPQSTGAFVDAEMASAGSPAAASRGFHATAAAAAAAAGAGTTAPVAADVRTISGLVSLTIDCLEDGLSDEATILQRHMKSPDFGHPLLRLASPSDNDPDYPHIPDDPEVRLWLLLLLLLLF